MEVVFYLRGWNHLCMDLYHGRYGDGESALVDGEIRKS
jgi:hypothetical protein